MGKFIEEFYHGNIDPQQSHRNAALLLFTKNS